MIRSLIKPVNALVSGYSFLISSVNGTSEISGMPVAVSVEMTNHCNLKCPECFSGSGLMTRGKGFMEAPLFDKIVTELKPYIFEMSLYFQGEPMLHPHFFSFLEKARDIRTTVSTNGYFLSADNAEMIAVSGLDELVVSLDGMDQASYSAYRVNGNVDVVMKGIGNVSLAIKSHRSPLKLVVQFLVNRENEHQIPLVKHFAAEMNASLKLKSMQILNRGAYEKWLPARAEFRRYEAEGNGYVIKSRLPDMCARMWFNPVITWDGKVLPCCFDKNADHVLGDLNEESFREIWTGPKYRLFRKSIHTGRNMTVICRNCTSGLYWKIKR